MRKLITLTLAVLLVGLFTAVVFAAVEAGDDSSSSTDTIETTETTGTTETTTTPDDDGARGVDISGPCDEAEHANDPRCTGVQPGAAPGAVVDDDRGRGRGGDDHGGNSGPGGDDDSSGPGSGGDDDNSGHGSDRD
jgi:hypothetical protein